LTGWGFVGRLIFQEWLLASETRQAVGI